MNRAHAAWRGALPILLSLLVGCSAEEVSNLGIYEGSDARRPIDAGWRDPGDVLVPPAAPVALDAGLAPAAKPEDTIPPPPYDATLDAGRDAARDEDAGEDGLVRCLGPGCLGAAVSDERQCFDLRAHEFMADGGYPLRSDIEEYVTFTFGAQTYNLRSIHEIIPIIDNAAVVHDIRLYNHDGIFPPGGVVPREGVIIGRAPADLNFLFAWKPGETPLSFEERAGISLSAQFLMLEIHYLPEVNLRPAFNGRDASGLRICGTPRSPLLPLSFARLASRMPDASGRSRCFSPLRVPIQLVGVFPTPQRESPVNATIFVERNAGTREMIYSTALLRPPTIVVGRSDEFWAFPLPAPVLYPGDELSWSCSYQDGSGAPDEGCALQLLHSPAGAISDGCEAAPVSPWPDAG